MFSFLEVHGTENIKDNEPDDLSITVNVENGTMSVVCTGMVPAGEGRITGDENVGGQVSGDETVENYSQAGGAGRGQVELGVDR